MLSFLARAKSQPGIETEPLNRSIDYNDYSRRRKKRYLIYGGGSFPHLLRGHIKGSKARASDFVNDRTPLFARPDLGGGRRKTFINSVDTNTFVC